MTGPEIVGWVVIGLAALLAAAAVLFGLWVAVALLWYRATPDHWTFLAPHWRRPVAWAWFTGPRRTRGRVGERHPATVRRLLGAGPVVVYAVRYRPGPAEAEQTSG